MAQWQLKPYKPKIATAKKRPQVLLASNDEMWESAGVEHKPRYCKDACPLYTHTPGIVYDWFPRDPKIALMLPSPQKGEMTENTPFKGSEASWWKRHIIYPMGLKMEDVAVAHALRCYHGKDWKGKKLYPAGELGRKSELACRHFDNSHCSAAGEQPDGLCQWDPNLFLITYDFADIMGTPAFYRQVVSDMQKALNASYLNFRPLVLCGKEPMALLAPWTTGKGGCKDWRGHHWEGTYPFQRGFVQKPTFR